MPNKVPALKARKDESAKTCKTDTLLITIDNATTDYVPEVSIANKKQQSQ